jgi:MFS family permease
MLVITLLLMGGGTFLIGLLPIFAQAGWSAPVLLVVLRFLQGLAVGGEWGGATLMTVEHVRGAGISTRVGPRQASRPA